MKKKSDNDSRDDADLDIPPVTREEMRRGVMGKYAREGGGAHRFVELEPDVAKVFRDSDSVNEVLRAIIKHMPARQKKSA